MRKTLFGMILCILLFFSLPVYAAEMEEISGEALILSDVLNVRSGPSTEDEIRGTLLKDQIVLVTGFVEPDWYVIDYGGQPGYINGEYLVFTPIEEPVMEQPQEEAFPRIYVIVGLTAGIVVVVILLVITLRSMRGTQEEIPVSDYDDTNMHMGEITYDTYRLDIDPSFFENTSEIPQPESVSEAERSRMLDNKLEEASMRLAALQREVEELKNIKQQATDTDI